MRLQLLRRGGNLIDSQKHKILALPSELPLGETKKLQEEKRKALAAMDSSGTLDIPNIMAMMRATYVSQRIDINRKLNMKCMLKQWPFIGLVCNTYLLIVTY